MFKHMYIYNTFYIYMCLNIVCVQILSFLTHMYCIKLSTPLPLSTSLSLYLSSTHTKFSTKHPVIVSIYPFNSQKSTWPFAPQPIWGCSWIQTRINNFRLAILFSRKIRVLHPVTVGITTAFVRLKFPLRVPKPLGNGRTIKIPQLLEGLHDIATLSTCR